MADIFISYAREDSPFVQALATALEAEGWSVWKDSQLVAGDRAWHEIFENLSAASCAVVVWSRHAVESEYVEEEAREAKDQNKVISVVIDDCVPLPGFRHVRQRVDLRGWNGARDAESYRNLVAGVKKLLHPEVSRKRAGQGVEASAADGTARIPALEALDVMPVKDVSYGVPDREFKRARKTAAAARRSGEHHDLIAEFETLKREIEALAGKQLWLSTLGRTKGIQLVKRNERTGRFDQPVELQLLGEEVRQDFSRADASFAADYRARAHEIEDALTRKRCQMATLVDRLLSPGTVRR